MYRCDNCGAEMRYDHDGNGCHACSRGFMRYQGDDTPSYILPEWRTTSENDENDD